MSTVGIALALAASLALGCGLLRVLGAASLTDRVAYLGWAWLCGSLATAVLTLAWLGLHKPIAGGALAPLALAAGSALLWSARRREVTPDRFEPSSTARSYWVVFALLLLVTLDAASHDCLSPILLGDEANIWAAKAKTMFVADGLGLPFALEATFYPVDHADYPILVPLMHVWIHAAAGEITHVAPRLPLIGVQLAFVLILGSAMRRNAGPWIAALLLVAVLGHGVALRIVGDAGADVPVACGLLLAVESYRRWCRGNEFVHGALCSIALGWTAWAKNEGLMLVLVFGIAVVVAAWAGRPRRGGPLRPSRGWWIVVLPLVVVLGQRALGGWWGFHNDLFAVSGHDGSTIAERVTRMPGRLGEVAAFFVENVLFRIRRSDDGVLGSTRLVLPLAWAAWLIWPRRGLRPAILVPTLVTAGGVAAYFIVFLITPHDLDWHLVTAAQRVSFHVTPIAAVALGALLSVHGPDRAEASAG